MVVIHGDGLQTELYFHLYQTNKLNADDYGTYFLQKIISQLTGVISLEVECIISFMLLVLKYLLLVTMICIAIISAK